MNQDDGLCEMFQGVDNLVKKLCVVHVGQE